MSRRCPMRSRWINEDENVRPSPKVPKENKAESCKIWLQFVGSSWGRDGNQEMYVNVDVPLKHYMDRYANEVGESRLRFFGPDGVRLKGKKTAEDYGLKNNAQIDVLWQY